MDEINLAEVRNMCLTNLYSCTDNISKYLNSSCKEQEFTKLRNYVKEYCKLEYQQNTKMQAIACSILQADDESDQETLEERYSNIRIPNIPQEHPYMTELEKHIKEAESRNRVAEEDQDVAITNTHRLNIDPLSQKPIQNPVKNRICEHIYELKTIESFIKTRNKLCPYVGCTNPNIITNEHLVIEQNLTQTL